MSRRLEYTKKIICPQTDDSAGFEYPNVNTRQTLLHFECGVKYVNYPYGCLVKLYAMVGIHRYNLLEGKNLQLHSLKSFNMRINCGASCYYITLVACVPDSGLQQTFQVLVHEGRLGSLDVTCTIARPLVTTKEPFLRRHSESESLYDYMYDVRLPAWPSEIAFNDKKRFYLMKESELQNNDWIRLYLELALVAHDRFLTDHYLSQLKIVQVAIENVEPLNARLDAKSAIVYIAYKDLAKAPIGEPVDYKVVVRRVINKTTGDLTLRGLWSGQTAWDTETAGGEKALNNEQRSKKLKRRLGVHRLWRLSNPRWNQGYKKRGLGSSG